MRFELEILVVLMASDADNHGGHMVALQAALLNCWLP
jgi:hypothetical protein